MHRADPSNSRRRGGINLRLILFLAIVSFPFLWFGYVFLNQKLTGGVEHHEDFDAVDLKALGYFQFDQQTGTLADVPDNWRALDGKRVMLEGFMYAGQSAAAQVADFEFVYNRQICCFNGPPRVQERVFVRVPDGRTVPYCDPMCRVWGTLHVNIERSESGGAVTSVYNMDEDRIEIADHNGWLVAGGAGAVLLMGVGAWRFAAARDPKPAT